jgi:glycosyltransferase involved in cell wall biosynthesis
MSDTCAQILLGRGVDSAKLSVVQNTFEYEQVEPTGQAPTETQTSGPFLVTHAVLIERAGVQVAIEAMALLRGRWPELRLVILGRGDHQADLELEAAQLRMTDRVVFRGFVPWHQAMQEISQAAVGIVPMLPDGYGELCLPMKLFDYASLGVPAVCSRLRAMAEHYPPDTVSFFRPGDAQDLAEKVNELLRHPEEAKTQAARAREAIRRFDWDVVSGRYLEALGLGEHAGKQASAA